MNANRRLQERKQPGRMVLCKLGGKESGPVLNLSEDGLCFESLTPIEKKDLLQLRLSVDSDSAVEATGKLAWIDEAKHTVGLRFLELGAPARDQIRAWLKETSTGSFLQRFDKQANDRSLTETPVSWQVTRIPSMQLGMQLVPIERHRVQIRWHFWGGVLLGFGIGAVAVLMIPALWHAGGTKLGRLAWTTAGASRAAQSSAEQTQASVAQPVSPNASLSEPAGRKPLATEPAAGQTISVAAPTRPPRKQSLQTAGASSAELMKRTSSLSAKPQPANAEQPVETSRADVARVTAASKANSFSGQAQQPKEAQHPKKVPATPQQLWSALQAGNVKAAITLADLYARGEGVPMNCQQARVLLMAASEKKNAEASKKLKELNEGGCPANSATNSE